MEATYGWKRRVSLQWWRGNDDNNNISAAVTLKASAPVGKRSLFLLRDAKRNGALGDSPIRSEPFVVFILLRAVSLI